MSSRVANIVYPIVKENIFPCGRMLCLCVEYLDFSKKNHVERYKQCMVTDLKNNKGPPPPFVKYNIQYNIQYSRTNTAKNS